MLEYSSLIFIIPALYALYKNNINYANAFLFLTIASFIYHKNNILFLEKSGINDSNNSNNFQLSGINDLSHARLYEILYSGNIMNQFKNWRYWLDQFAIFILFVISVYYYINYCNEYNCQLIIFICFISGIVLFLLNIHINNNKIHLVVHLLACISYNIIIFSL